MPLEFSFILPWSQMRHHGRRQHVLGNKTYHIPRIPTPPKVINNANQPSTLRKVLGKSNPDSIIIPRPQPVPDTDGMQAHQGLFRHQRKDLPTKLCRAKKWTGRLCLLPIQTLHSSTASLDNLNNMCLLFNIAYWHPTHISATSSA